MTISAVRSAMATALRTITDLRASEYITDQVSPPHAMFDYEIEPDMTFGRGSDVYRFTGWVYAARTPEVASQKFLDLIRDPNNTDGLKYTLENDATLAAEVELIRVTRIGRVEEAELSGAKYLMFPWDAEVVI